MDGPISIEYELLADDRKCVCYAVKMTQVQTYVAHGTLRHLGGIDWEFVPVHNAFDPEKDKLALVGKDVDEATHDLRRKISAVGNGNGKHHWS